MTESHSIEAKIGVVTVTYNSGSVLPEFLESLALQTYKNIVLYVIDNDSKDETLEIVSRPSKYKIVTIANPKNVGVAAGNNLGIRSALEDGCQCILLLNNDTVFPEDLIAELYAGLERYNCDMSTAKMFYHDSPNVLWYGGGRFPAWRGLQPTHDGFEAIDTGQYDQPRRVTYTPTCCLLLRRSVVDRVGMMDEAYFAYCDDTDYLLRCLQHRISLWYVPRAKLWHKVSSLTKSQPEFTARLLARNRIYLIRKHMPAILAHVWYWLEQLRYALEVLFRRSSSKTWRVRRLAAKDGWAMTRNLR